MPKLNRFAKSSEDVLDNVTLENEKRNILAAYKAIEGFVMFSCIAIGLLQICSYRFSKEINLTPLAVVAHSF